MSIDNVEPAQTTDKPEPRSRRSAKLLLILLALSLCAWLAATLVRTRRADQILGRHDAVLDALITNIATPPAGTTFQAHPGEPAELQRLLGRTWPDQETRRNAILEFGSPNRAVSTRVTLDLAEALGDESEQEVARRLADGYAEGLAAAGLKRIVSGGGTNQAAVWKSPDNALDVWIDVDVDPDASSAEVQIIFIDTQRLTLW